MKSTLQLAFFAAGFLFAACDSETEPVSDDITPLKFETRSDFEARYDEYEVDTAGTFYNKPILSTRTEVEETITDTGLTFEGMTRVSRHIAYYPSTGKRDTLYFAQDANGDLYRYNYGFNLLNNFPELVSIIGRRIDMKWVLVMKFGKKQGAEWIARKDSLELLSYPGVKVYFESKAVMQADTTIQVGNEQVSCRHAMHTITATSSIGATGLIKAHTYISAKYGKVVWDFIESGSISGTFNARVRGVWKIMTFHEEI